MKIVADKNIPEVQSAFSHLGDVNLVNGRELEAGQLRDADMLIVRSVTPVDERLLGRSKLTFVGSATIGTDHVDLAYLQRRNIAFANAPGCNATSAAEYVTAALLDLAEQQEFELHDQRVGVVGNGNVGSRVVQRLEGLGCEVRVYDPPREARLHDREYATWSDIRACDIVTAHVPLTRSGDYPTYRMFDSTFFGALRDGAVFVNTSRGGAVDEAALKRRLDARHPLTLVLDVWQNEPAIDIELLDRTEIATPHIAGYSREGKLRGLEMVYNAACRYLHVEPQWAMQQALPDLQQELVPVSDGHLQGKVNRLVKYVYDIRADDSRLRHIGNLTEDARGSYFDQLRKNYPERREFFNYCLRASEHPADVIRVCRHLGFTITD